MNPFFSNKPTEVLFELTNKCNLRCKMCGIWSEPEKITIGIEKFEAVLKETVLKKVKSIALTGGEPFLIPDFEKYYTKAKEIHPEAYINISTNGFLTKKMLRFLNQVDTKNLSITISYDGIHSHDQIRRVKNSKQNLITTAKEIQSKYPFIPLSLKLTVTPQNYSEVLDTAVECLHLSIPFRFKTMEKINCHQNRSPSEIDTPDYTEEIKQSIVSQAKKILKLPNDSNKVYIKNLIQKFEGKKVTKCLCQKKRIFIGVDGNVFLCRKKSPMGNVHTSSLSALWHSDRKKVIIQEMRTCGDTSESLTYINS